MPVERSKKAQAVDGKLDFDELPNRIYHERALKVHLGPIKPMKNFIPTYGPADPNAQYCVCFRDDDGTGQIAHVTYKGPFPDMWAAEDYARLNPHNIAGLKTIHALNRP